jgi:putative DNA primase/helicase
MNGPVWTGVAQAAREWHRLGYRLAAWPARQGKAPQASGWGRAAADPLRVSDADNIGVNHALSGTCCIDIDDMADSAVVLEFFGLDVEELRASTIAWTGRPDRLKLLFRAPAGGLPPVKLKVRRRTEDREQVTILELRGAQQGGQVQDVLPPSIHPDTRQPYKLLTELRPVSELPELPAAVVDAWRNWKSHEPALRRLLGDVDLIERDRMAARQRPADSVIEAFNAHNGVADILERNGYQRKGARRWLRPDSTTGVPGVVLLDDGKVYAHCGGPLSDQHAHDAFDCFALLEHGGDVSRAVRAAAEALGLSRAANDDAGRIESSEPWPEPQPLPSALPPVEPFDIELLPDALRGWAVDVAERMSAPIDFPAVAMMTMLGGVLGRRAGIAPKRHDDEWIVVPNLWGAIVGKPTSKKSPGLDAALEPLRDIEADEARAHRSAAADARLAEILRQYEAKATESAIRKATEAGDRDKARELARTLANAEDDAPKLRRFTTSDPTVAKLGELLRDNPAGLLLERDELSGFFANLERAGCEGDRQFYLEAANGNAPWRVDRIGRGEIHVEAACLSVLGGIQPGPLTALVRDAGGREGAGSARDDGMLARFSLFTWPDLPPFKLVDRLSDPKARTAVAAVVARFAYMPAPTGRGVAMLLRFDEAAQGEFLRWLEEHERRLREASEHSLLDSHLGKYIKAVPALALIGHLADHEHGPVGLPALRRAIGWARYLESHARRVYSSATRPEIGAAHLLDKRIARGDLGETFTARDVYRNGWSGLPNHDIVTAGCELLVRLGRLRVVEVETGGRPSVRYLANPRLKRQQQEAA